VAHGKVQNIIYNRREYDASPESNGFDIMRNYCDESNCTHCFGRFYLRRYNIVSPRRICSPSGSARSLRKFLLHPIENELTVRIQAPEITNTMPKRRRAPAFKLRDEENIAKAILSSQREVIKNFRAQAKRIRTFVQPPLSEVLTVPRAISTPTPNVPYRLEIPVAPGPTASDEVPLSEISMVPEPVLTPAPDDSDELGISEGPVEIDEPIMIQRPMASDEVSMIPEPVLTLAPDVPAETEEAMPEEPSASEDSGTSTDNDRDLSPVAAALRSRVNANLLKMCRGLKSRKVSDFETLIVFRFATETRDQWFKKRVVVDGQERTVQMTHIMEVIGYSRPWFTLAKRVVELAKGLSDENVERLKESYKGIKQLAEHFKDLHIEASL
jgi:hypothetical protein